MDIRILFMSDINCDASKNKKLILIFYLTKWMQMVMKHYYNNNILNALIIRSNQC